MTVRELLNSERIENMGVKYISGYDVTEGTMLKIFSVSEKQKMIDVCGNCYVMEWHIVLSQYRPPLLAISFEW